MNNHDRLWVGASVAIACMRSSVIEADTQSPEKISPQETPPSKDGAP
jgi:hypothetical protein